MVESGEHHGWSRPMGFDEVEAVFAGSLVNLPEKESSVVRIFLSSTFTDMQVERNWLMKNAVPHLRKFCEERGLDFQIADMRWGVREDATDDHRTAELCIHEIKNCQKVSRGPNFVAFLGDKYGYRPMPSEIQATEFKLLKKTAMRLGHDASVLLSWYLCDYNREPNVYALQPISSQYPAYFDMTPANTGQRQQAQREWWGVVDKLSLLLRESADCLYQEGKLSEQEKHKYFQSVTEHEVSVGILEAKDIQDKVLCFQRTLIDINYRDNIAGRFTDLIENSLDHEADKLRADLCMIKVPDNMPHTQLFKYNLPWDKIGLNIFRNQEHISYIETFGQDFISSIEKMILKSLQDKASTKFRSPLFEEILHHLHFCRTKCQDFCGREKLLEDIRTKLTVLHKVTDVAHNEKADFETEGTRKIEAEDIVETQRKAVMAEQKLLTEHLTSLGVIFTLGDTEFEDDSDPKSDPKRKLAEILSYTEYSKPLIVCGISGSGKTALMSKAAELSATWFPGSVLMVRFLGTSAMSTTIREVLVSLCMQIWEVYQLQRPTGIELDSDIQFLVRYFAALLWKIDTSERPLVIVLDSVDQLSNADHAHMLHWLPHNLPPGVHMLVSVVSDRLDCLKSARLLFPDAEQFIEIDQIETEVANDIIDLFCKHSNRHMSKKQKNLILNQFSKCSQPLYLKLLMDMSLSWKSYTTVNEKALGVTVKEAVNHLFDNLERNHGAEIIKKGIGYLCAAKEGLTEAEIEDLLSLDDEVLQDTYIYHLPPDPDIIRLPPLLWKRVQFDIREYIVERQSGVKKVITWYHRQFVEAARERYLVEDTRKRFHMVLAEYFLGTWSGKAKPLQLTKGKRGTYHHASRQVPQQPIKFCASIYNTRKLSELAHHLIHSQQFQLVLSDLFCDPDWLFAKCCTTSLTSLMEDLHHAEKMCALHLEQLKADHVNRMNLDKKEDQNETAKLHMQEDIFEAIQIISRMVLQVSDNIRKDPANLPQMILAQLGPSYGGNVYIEKFVQRCEEWCENQNIPLLVPTRECMLKPGGHLLYTIDVDVSLIGENRDSSFQGSYLREDLMQLYVVKQQSRDPDQICVFDLHDNGSCITTDDLHLFIRSIKFVADNSYVLLDVYTTKDEFNPKSKHQLFEHSTASPVMFDPTPTLIAVSSSGKIVACSSGKAVTVYKKDKHLRLQKSVTFETHASDIQALIISPDESLIVTTDIDDSPWSTYDNGKICVHSLRNKKQLNEVDKAVAVSMQSLVTKNNLLVSTKSQYSEHGTLVVYDLVAGQIVLEVVVNENYQLENLQLHLTDQFVFMMYQDTGVLNGIREKYAEIVDITSGERFGRCAETYIGPYLGGTLFGTESLYYAVCQWNKSEVAMMFAGHVSCPLRDAVVVHVLRGHNQPVREILVPSSLDMMLTVAKDNTVKVWDLKSILGTFTSDLSRIEENLIKNTQNDLEQYFPKNTDETRPSMDMKDIVSHYKPRTDVCDTKSKTTAVAFNRFGESLYVGTDSGDLQLYDVDSSKLKLTTHLDIGPIHLMQLSRNSRFMIVAGQNKIHIEDLQSQKPTVLESRGVISCMAEGNNILVAGSAGMEAKGRVWNIETGSIIKDFELLYSFYCVAINSIGTKVVSSMFDFPVVVNLASTDEDLGIDPDKMDTMMSGGICCKISPDDQLAALSSSDGAVRVITLAGQYKYRLQQRSSAVALVFTADSQQLLSAGYRTIYVWSMLDGSRRYKLSRHTDFINSITFDDSGRFFLTVSRDKQLILWEYNRMVSIASFQANCLINTVDVASKGNTIAYIPESISDVAILKPNKELRKIMCGHSKGPSLVPQVQALALAFSSQSSARDIKSQACSVM